MIKAYSYVRMSTDMQLKGDSLRRQTEASTKYAQENDLELVSDRALADIGISAFKGQNSTTGALGKFLEAARNGLIDEGSYLLVESLDRISRQEAEIAVPLFLEIIKLGIVLVTLNDKRLYRKGEVDFATLMMPILVMQRAHEESAIKSFRVGAAWSAKRKNASIQKLTSRCPAWLKLSSDKHTFDVIENRAEIVRRIFAEATAGIGAYTIARRLNREEIPAFVTKNGWHTSSINKIINNRSAIGEFQPHHMLDGKRRPVGDVIRNYFPPIIDAETFHAAQAIRRQKRKGSGGRRGALVSNLFSKIATCAYCKGKMYFQDKGEGPKGGRYLACERQLRALGCQGGRWRYDQFEASFLAFVEELDLGALLATEGESKRRNEMETKLKSLKSQLQDKLEDRERIFSLREQMNSEFLIGKLKSCEEEIQTVTAEIDVLKRQLDDAASAADSYYISKEKIGSLVNEIARGDSDDNYKVRAQIALKLQSIITQLELAPVGRFPFIQLASDKVEELMAQDGAWPGWESVQEAIKTPGLPGERYFVVATADGTIRIVYPRADDPLKVHQQILKKGGNGHPELLFASDSQRPTDGSEDPIEFDWDVI